MEGARVKKGLVILTLAMVSTCIHWAASPVLAEFPDRPLNILVSFAAGGSSDMSFRALAIGAEKYLGQSIIVENKGGGGGTLALANIANAKPDGYTLCQAASTGIARAPQMQKVTYKPLKSFTPMSAHITRGWW
jgi:tripartite-type tricarboxylate transporter receptor subunit TctC